MKATGQIAGVVAFIVAVLLVPVVGKLCHRWSLFDWPGPLRIHSRPIPRLGGIAVAAAIACGVLVTAQRFGASTSASSFLAPFGLIWTVGLIDDLYGLSPVSRIAAHLAAGALLWHAGWRVSALERGAPGLIVVCLFVAIFVNAMNLFDGADGVAAGVSGIIGVAYIVLSGAANDVLASALAWSLAGACAAFLCFNFPIANIFGGDSASTALGFAIAFLGLDFYRSRPATSASLLIPLVVAGLPLLDTGLTVLRRLRNPRSLLYGDRAHFYDLLAARGWPPRRVALTCYLITGGLSVIGWIGEQEGPMEFLALAALGVGVLLIAAIRLGALRLDPAERPSHKERVKSQRGVVGIPD